MNKGAWSCFHNTSCYNGKLLSIEQVYPSNLFKSKLKIIGEIGHLLGIVGNPND
jgi:hypothetical protein